MLFKKKVNLLITAAIITGTNYTLASSVLSQPFYYPSASFFNPFASNYQSEEDEDEATLASILSMDEKYKMFNSSLEKAGLLETIDRQNSITVFAPTNEAFEALSPDLKKKLSEPEILTQVLQYHLVMGNIGEDDIKRQAVATVLKQNAVEITGVPVGNKVGVKLNNAMASEPLAASNGVIIPIDRVLIPPSLKQ
jgi:uncharacterized surface protein with fasciclin (FAS1) repeats